jgi:hypothetical protein
MVCPVCSIEGAKLTSHPTHDAYSIKCAQCGPFTIARRAQVNIDGIDDSARWKISAWLVENAPPIFSESDIDAALGSPTPTLHKRADRMLRWIRTKFPPSRVFEMNDLGHTIYSDEPIGGALGSLVASPLVPVGWNRDLDEMSFMVIEVLHKEMGFLLSQNKWQFQISPKGLLHLEGRAGEQSSVGFCAMWFNDEVKPIWTQVIEPAVRSAGYEPLRIDSKQHNDKIDDEIMASIRASRFVVADFTGNRGGVYYEAGFAHGLGLPVIFMCREGDDLHFDIRQYNCIFWKADQLEEAQARLKNRILATLGQGPLRVQ